jgi:polysaccharide biosynthesis protein PelG
MAGIGFELRKLLAKPGYLNTLRAYGYAALISSGPWVLSIVSLALLGIVCRGMASDKQMELVFAAVTYVYALSLILTGPVQMVLTRYAADQYFSHRTAKIFPAIMTTLAFTSFLSAVIGLVLFVGFVPAPLLFQLSSACLLVLVTSIWVMTVALTASKNYHGVLISFMSGYALSFLAAWTCTLWLGPSATMLGMVAGHFVLLLLLVRITFKEIGEVEVKNFEVFGYFRKYRDLAFCGLFYNLGIWIDKILFWFISSDRKQVSGILYTSPDYDQVVYLSFLTIVPGMAVFLLTLETGFATHYEQFVKRVLGKGTLEQITEAKEGMVKALRAGFGQLIKIQGGVTLLLIIFADRLLPMVGLGAVQGGSFQITTLGVFLLVLFLSQMTILFYLGKLRDAMICCLVFALINGTVTAWSIYTGEQWYGVGFLMASAAAVTLAATRVNRHLDQLEYDTFTSQSIHG